MKEDPAEVPHPRRQETMMTVADFQMLLVEHDPEQVRLAQEAFAKANLVNPLRVVQDTEEAMEYLSERRDRTGRPLPSLLLLDLDHPRRQSIALVEWMAGRPPLKAIPVVLLVSPATDPEDLARARRAGVTAALSKPVDLEGLLRMMQSVGMYWMILDRRPAPPAAGPSGDSAPRRQDTDILGHRISFQKTSWELVRAARSSEALDGLIRIYWKPLYFFVRQKGYDNETAKDLVQDFLTAALEHDTLSKADPARGRFRTFLLAALTNFIRDWNRAATRLKRGGGHPPLSLDFEGGEREYAHEAASHQTPEALFHRAWAQGVLAHCISELKGKPAHLRAFELLMGGARYPEICRETGLNESAAKTAVHRLRQQLRTLLMGSIAKSRADEEGTEGALAEFASYLV